MRPAGRGLEPPVRVGTDIHIGASPKRTLLEDRVRAGTITTASGLVLTLGVVADGIGGENAGERAAEVTANVIFEHCERSSERDIPTMLTAALREANERVYSEARRSRRKSNMGSTAAVTAIAGNHLYLAHVGDSRIYLVRGRETIRLTRDHTWADEVVRSGKLSAREAAKHPRKDEIVRSVGYQPTLEPDLGVWLQGGRESESEARAAQGMVLQPGDLVVLCSDGLIKSRHDNSSAHYVEEAEFPGLVYGRSSQQAARAMVRRALARQVDDNVSVVILEMPGRRQVPRLTAPVAGAFAALVVVLAAGAWYLPRFVAGADSRLPTPTIPALPSGVAYVSQLAGSAEMEKADGTETRSLRAEDIVVAGEGVRLRTNGQGSFLRLGLADQSIFYLGPNSEIELKVIADGVVAQETQVVLNRGAVLVYVEPKPGYTFMIGAPSGVGARLPGSLMGVIYDEAAGRFDLDCFHERCELVPGPEMAAMVLTSGQHTSIAAGVAAVIDATRNELYSFGDWGGGLVLTPTTAGGSLPSRTPLGPLFVPPTPRPIVPTQPPPPQPSGPKPTKPPSATQPPPPTVTDTQPPSDTTPTRTRRPTRTATPETPPSDTPVPPPSDTPVPPPSDTPAPPPDTPTP